MPSGCGHFLGRELYGSPWQEWYCEGAETVPTYTCLPSVVGDEFWSLHGTPFFKKHRTLQTFDLRTVQSVRFHPGDDKARQICVLDLDPAVKYLARDENI